MGVIRNLWDLLAPVGPDRVDDWGEAISDKVDGIAAGEVVRSDTAPESPEIGALWLEIP